MTWNQGHLRTEEKKEFLVRFQSIIQTEDSTEITHSLCILLISRLGCDEFRYFCVLVF